MVYPLHSVGLLEALGGNTPAPVRMIRLASALGLELFVMTDSLRDGSTIIHGTAAPVQTLMLNVLAEDWQSRGFADLVAVWATCLPEQVTAIPHDRRHTGTVGDYERFDLYLGGMFASPN